MADVVLDENVYVRALESECTGDEEDARAARVVAIVQQSHRWLFTPEVVAAYYQHFATNRCMGGTTVRLMTSLKDVFVDLSRFEYIQDAEVVPGLYDRQDRHVVSAAASRAGSSLVTLDRRLIHALERAGIPDQYGFRAIDVETAEVLLGASSSL